MDNPPPPPKKKGEVDLSAYMRRVNFPLFFSSLTTLKVCAIFEIEKNCFVFTWDYKYLSNDANNSEIKLQKTRKISNARPTFSFGENAPDSRNRMTDKSDLFLQLPQTNCNAKEKSKK